jgi:hypothetical protein
LFSVFNWPSCIFIFISFLLPCHLYISFLVLVKQITTNYLYLKVLAVKSSKCASLVEISVSRASFLSEGYRGQPTLWPFPTFRGCQHPGPLAPFHHQSHQQSVEGSEILYISNAHIPLPDTNSSTYKHLWCYIRPIQTIWDDFIFKSAH